MSPSSLRAVLAGLCASLVGIGLARFAYTPLIPPLIEAHWFAADDVLFLSAANLIGYLAGALAGRPLAARTGSRRALQLMMALATLSFFACAVPVSVPWFFFWRFLSGVAGGIIMVLAATSILPHVPPERRGLASGMIFLGVGLGIAGSGTVLPSLLALGLAQTWLGLGLMAAVLTALSWTWWPQPLQAAPGTPAPAPAPDGHRGKLRLIYAQYAINGIGFVPMMVFIVDFIARGLGWGAHDAALFWVLYGVGAMLGPMLYGGMADKLGVGFTSVASILGQLAAVALLVSSSHHAAIAIATFVLGTYPPGIVPLYLSKIHHAVHGNPAAHTAAFSRATMIFALIQALAGYASSWLLSASGGNHRLLFMAAAAALLLCMLADLTTLRRKSATTK